MKAFWALYSFWQRRQLLYDLLFLVIVVGTLAVGLKSLALYTCFAHSILLPELQCHYRISGWDGKLMTMPVSAEALICSRYGLMLVWTLLRTAVYCGASLLFGLGLSLAEPVNLLGLGVMLAWIHYRYGLFHPESADSGTTGFWGRFWLWLLWLFVLFTLVGSALREASFLHWCYRILLVVFTFCFGIAWIREVWFTKYKDWR